MTDQQHPYSYFPVGHAYTPAQNDEIAEVQEVEPGHRSSPAHVVAGYLRALGHPLFQIDTGGAAPVQVVEAQRQAAPAPVAARQGGLNFGAPQRLASHGAAVGVLVEQTQPSAAPVPQGEPMLPAAPFVPAGGDGMDDMDATDFVVPRLKTKQPMTEGADDVRNGHTFLSTDTSDAAETRRLAVLYMRRGREVKLPRGKVLRDAVIDRVETKFGRPLTTLKADAFSICRSDDRHAPAANVETPLSASCEGCQFAQWDKAAKVKDCRETYEAAVIDLDTMQPALVNWRGGAAKEIKKLNASIKVAKRRYKVESAHELEFNYGSTVRDGADGLKFYAPEFGRVTKIEDPDLVEELGAIRDSISGARHAPDTGDGDDAGGAR